MSSLVNNIGRDQPPPCSAENNALVCVCRRVSITASRRISIATLGCLVKSKNNNTVAGAVQREMIEMSHFIKI